MIDEAVLKELAGTPEDLEELFGKVKTFVDDYLSDKKTTSFPPHLAVMTKGGPGEEAQHILAVIAVDFSEPQEKRTILRQIGADMHAQKRFPICACLASEAWASFVRPGSTAPHCQPRHDPAKKEVISLFAGTLGGHGKGRLALLEIERGDGDVMLPGKWDVSDDAGGPLLAEFFQGFKDAHFRAVGSPN